MLNYFVRLSDRLTRKNVGTFTGFVSTLTLIVFALVKVSHIIACTRLLSTSFAR